MSEPREEGAPRAPGRARSTAARTRAANRDLVCLLRELFGTPAPGRGRSSRRRLEAGMTGAPPTPPERRPGRRRVVHGARGATAVMPIAPANPGPPIR